MKEVLLAGKDICREFQGNAGGLVLNHITLDIYAGDFTVIMGSSGAGKSTLLYALSGMDEITGGEIWYKGREISRFKEKQMSGLRTHEFGFVFQQTHLVSNLTLYENVVVAGYLGSVPLMLLFTALAALGQGPWQGDMNAVIASCSEYTYLTKGKRVDGTMYSCTSLGVKLGGGLGTALAGWLLEFSGFDGKLAIQPDSCIDMLHFMYLWLPFLLDLMIMLVLSLMRVEKANEKIKAEQKAMLAKEQEDGDGSGEV